MTEYPGHMDNCAINDEGPCTCGTEEELEYLARQEEGLTEEDYE
jgi:hypothetical protein